jgi:hypothetical protein
VITHCHFAVGSRVAELDQFVSPHKGLYLLEFYAELDRDVNKMLPTFLRYEREVTNDPAYSMRVLAQKTTGAPGSSGAAGGAIAAGDNPAAAFRRNGRSASVTHTPSETGPDGQIADEARLLGVPERQHSGELGLTHAISSAPTTPQLKASLTTAAAKAAITEHKL